MSLAKRTQQCNWHPCTQMKDFETMPPWPIVKAEGCWVEGEGGHRMLDASSSWWCKALGHRHPLLLEALYAQSERFDHVIFANTTYDAIVELSEQLKTLLPAMSHAMYASDGSCAVEMALKLSVHAQALLGHKERSRFATLCGAYHGETGLALSVSDCGLYCDPFTRLLPKSVALNPVPYVTGVADPLWGNAEGAWQQWEAILAPHEDSLSAIIVEPIVQGANNMQLYSADALRRLGQWAADRGIHIIVDEIMTGFWRTGRLWAHEYAGITPDMVCLGKGLTGGMMPMSAMLTTQAVFDVCYDDYDTSKAFLHSHTHSGNALAAAVALQTVSILSDPTWQGRVDTMAQLMHAAMQGIANRTGRLKYVRGMGGVMAADLVLSEGEPKTRMGHQIACEAMKRGVLLRPLGNTLYWVPPLIISKDELATLAQVTEAAIEAVC